MAEGETARRILVFGTEEAPPEPRLLRAGPLSALLEGGALRTIRLGGVEVIRGIAFLVRDRAWATLAPEITDFDVSETPDGFAMGYTATVRDGAQTLTWRASIRGSPAELGFACEATALTRFETCRTGFVVLHPIAGVAGRRVRIEHVDGRVEEGRFPALIDPVQPMRDLRALTHEAAPGLSVTCRMEGDTFEMEDQRNWTDASFKTYVRPLALPWPFTLAAGERLAQRVTLSFAGAAPASAATDAPIAIVPGEATGATMPPLGLGCFPEEAEAALPHAARLRAAGLATLVCRHDPRQGHDAATLGRYRALAAAIGAGVEVQLVVPSLHDYAADLEAAAAAMRQAGLHPEAVMVVPAADLVSTPPGSPWPEAPPLDALYRAARAAFPGLRLGGGMFTHFTELNRKRPPADLIDFVTFSTTAIVHAADDRSVMETIEALPDVCASARAIAGERPFVVGPSAIGMRDNPNGPGPLPNPGGIRLPMAARDPRQRGLFNAAWTLGAIAAFAEGGAARIALAAPVGDFGILDADGVWPVYHVLRACAALRGGVLRTVRAGPRIAALAANMSGADHLLLGNLADAPITLALPEAFAGAPCAVLDAASLARGGDALEPRPESRAPAELVLDAYAVARIVRAR